MTGLRPWATRAALALGALAAGLLALEATARYVLDLGNPVLHYNAAWGGVRPIPGQQVTRRGGATVTIDPNGYRTAEPGDTAGVRILYLGDSVTYGGTYIDDANLFSEVAAGVVERSLGPVYAMNAGVNATGLLNHADLLRGVGSEVDLVVWLFPWQDSFRPYATTIGVRYHETRPTLALVEVVDFLLAKLWYNSEVVRGTRYPEVDYPPEVRLDDYGRFVDRNRSETHRRNLAALRSAVDSMAAGGVPVILGVTPRRVGSELRVRDAARRLVDSLAAENPTVHAADVAAFLREGEAGVVGLFSDDVHYSSEGHAAVGRGLGEMIVEVLAEREEGGAAGQQEGSGS